MTQFVKYQHIQRIDPDNPEVEGLLNGKVTIQVKLDGTNASMGKGADGQLWYGKRSCRMGEGDDNAQFKATVSRDPKYGHFFERHPDVILYGEWLVKHTIKYYPDGSWYKFYVFDVCEQDEEGHIARYLTPDEYIPWLKDFNIEYVPVHCVLENPTIEELKDLAESVHFLTQGDDKEEGIVIKRYDYVNPYGRITWGKVVRGQFKISSRVPKVDGSIEESIVDNLLTKEFVDKEYAKIIEEEGGKASPYLIPKVIGVVFHTFIAEEIGTILKKYKMPTIDFLKLKKKIESKTKEYLGW